MRRFTAVAFLLSLSFVTISQTPSAFAQAAKQDIHAIEAKYQENALSAKKSYIGSTVKFQVFVTKIDEKNGKPLLQTDIVYFNDGIPLYCDVWLSTKSIAAALTLKPGDAVEVSGVLRKRESLTKSQIQSHGYASDGSGTTWSLYTIDNGTVKILPKGLTNGASATKQAKLSEEWVTAISVLSVDDAQKVMDKGLDIVYVDAVIHEIATRDPGIALYDKYVTFYDWALHQKGINVKDAVGDVFEYKRPKLVQKILDADALNLKYQFTNGDNLFHFLLKEKTKSEEAPKTLETTFNDADAEIIEMLCKAVGAKGLGDQKDKYGKTPKDYVKEGSPTADASPAFKRIKDAILAMP